MPSPEETVAASMMFAKTLTQLMLEFDMEDEAVCNLFAQTLAARKIRVRGFHKCVTLKNLEQKSQLTTKVAEELNELIDGYTSDILECES